MHEKDGGEGGKLQSGKTDALHSHIPDKTLLEGIPTVSGNDVEFPEHQGSSSTETSGPWGRQAQAMWNPREWKGPQSQSFYSCS